jgi:hypothetical protein
MRAPPLLAAIGLTLGIAHAQPVTATKPDPLAEASPLIQRAGAAGEKGKWEAAIADLRTARYILTREAGAKDPRTLHASVLLVQALIRAAHPEDAISEGVALLKSFDAIEGTPPPDALYLRYHLANAFTACTAPRCGPPEHRAKNVDALMEALLNGLAQYPKGDAKVAELRADFAQVCMQRYEPADCAGAQGK